MKIRGDRECKSCGTEWSYYETGSIACPECGSLKSVGIEDRKEHTASPVTLDLDSVRAGIDDRPVSELATEAASECRSYVRQYGFIAAGAVQPLAETYLAARELAGVGGSIARSMRTSDDEEYYLLTLLRTADDGERPDIEIVPSSMRAVRGLAYARGVDHYRSDLRRYLDEHPDELAASLVSTLGQHQKRIDALDGDVPLSDSEALVGAAQSLGQYLRTGEEHALAQAQDRLDSF